jgi:hypothetical protein
MWFVAVDSAAVACESGSISKMIPAGHPQCCMQVCWEGPVGAPKQGFPHLLLDLCHHLLACEQRLALAASAKRTHLPKAGRWLFTLSRIGAEIRGEHGPVTMLAAVDLALLNADTARESLHLAPEPRERGTNAGLALNPDTLSTHRAARISIAGAKRAG